MYAVLTIALCGCTNDMEELNSPEPMTRAVNSAQIVWEAQPGTIDVKQGQAVTVTLDGQIILKSATTRLYDTEAKIICIVSKKGAQCIECHHKDI